MQPSVDLFWLHIAPITQHHRDSRNIRLCTLVKDQRAIQAYLFLQGKMAVIPVGACLDDREFLNMGGMGRYGLMRHIRHAVHSVGQLDTMPVRSEEHTSELQSLMRIPYAVFCLHKKYNNQIRKTH